jgi:hypothetical protein
MMSEIATENTALAQKIINKKKRQGHLLMALAFLSAFGERCSL